MRLLLTAAVVTACTAPPIAAPVPAPPPPPAYVPIAFRLPPAPAPVTVQRVCTAAPRPTAPATMQKHKIYDFTPTRVTLAYGPAPDTDARVGWERDEEAIRGAIIARRHDLESCVGVARVSGFKDWSAKVRVKLVIQPFGNATDIDVDGPPALACVKDALAGLSVTRPTPRVTRATVTLALENLDRVSPRKDATYAKPSRWGCMVARDPMPTDELTMGTVAMNFATPGRRRRRCSYRQPDKATIRAAVNENLGTLRGCYVDAAKRLGALRGTVDVSFMLDEWGTAASVTATGAGDAALHACVEAAFGQLVTATHDANPIEVHVPLELDPDPVAAEPAETFAERAMERGDVDSAAAAWRDRAMHARSLDEECHARVKLLETYAAAGPDPRIDDALAAFGAFLDVRKRPPACIANAAPVLTGIATWSFHRTDPSTLHLRRGRGLVEAIRRTRQLLRIVPELRVKLLPFVVEAELARLHVKTALAEALAFFALPGATPEDRVRVAEAYARGVPIRDGVYPYDDCESDAPY